MGGTGARYEQAAQGALSIAWRTGDGTNLFGKVPWELDWLSTVYKTVQWGHRHYHIAVTQRANHGGAHTVVIPALPENTNQVPHPLDGYPPSKVD